MDGLSSGLNEQPLAGRHVLVTRPLDRLGDDPAEEDVLTTQLTEWGAQVHRIPLIAVHALPWRLSTDTAWDWLFFTSQNAVHAFYAATAPLPESVKSLPVAVVGPATGAALAVYGYSPAFIAPQFDAENAARAFCNAHACQGLQMLWPCGNLARSQLSEILNQAGARVTPLTVYETCLREALTPSEMAVLSSGVDMVVLASPSAVEAFHRICQTHSVDWDSLAIACLGPKTAEAAGAQLGRVDVQPLVATLEALAEAIKHFFNGRRYA